MKRLFKFLVLVFVALLLVPGTLASVHVLTDHEHASCDNYAESHFHKSTVDCELFEFQQHSFSLPELGSFEPLNIIQELTPPLSSYSSYSSKPSLGFALRGPPSLE